MLLEELLEWSLSIPMWQRAALRVIVQHGTPTEANVLVLADHCKKPYGLATPSVELEPLLPTDVPAAQTTSPVKLLAVEHVGYVNALAPGQRITFGNTGVTVIYGDNGAGKSGYSRILKRACRARGADDRVLPNLLLRDQPGQPTANIDFTIGGVTEQFVWKDGEPAPATLAAISVFDTAAAAVYVTEKTDVAYRPFGLDIMDKLAATCTAVRGVLEKEKQALERAGGQLPSLAPDTAAGRFVAGLNALTPPSDIEFLATFSVEDRDQATKLETILAMSAQENPARRAAEFRQSAVRLKALAKHMIDAEAVLGEKALQGVAAARSALATATTAAGLARTSLVNAGTLPHVGEHAWRLLWDAATQYAVVAGQQPFPPAAGLPCVLCQQPLDATAHARLVAFHGFVQGAAERAADAGRAALKRASDPIERFDPTPPHLANTVEELKALDSALSSAVGAFLAEAKRTRDSILGVSDTSMALPAALGPAAMAAAVLVHAQRLEKDSEDVVRNADPAARRESEKILSELKAKEAFAKAKTAISDEVQRLARLNAYEKCLKDTLTNKITTKSTDLTKKHVTEALAAAFAAETKKLGFTHHELVLTPVGGQRGTLFHQIKFKHADWADLGQVTSEGESRCLALAAFFAELHTSGSAAGVVFDDPLSSLDHRWRGNVVNRLVEEAKSRQVIVFTHELVFLCELMEMAEQENVPLHHRQLRREEQNAGHVSEDAPWRAMKVKARIGVLREDLVKAEKILKTDSRMYEQLAKGIYANMRQTWERGVEEILFADTVQRFRNSIQTQSLKKIDVVQEDLDAIEAGMTKSSKWEGGHDHARAQNDPVPRPDDVRKDIDALETWMKAVNNRRDKKSKPPPAALPIAAKP